MNNGKDLKWWDIAIVITALWLAPVAIWVGLVILDQLDNLQPQNLAALVLVCAPTSIVLIVLYLLWRCGVIKLG